MLLNFKNSCYEVNFADFLICRENENYLIYDQNKILEIIDNTALTVYPSNINIDLSELIRNKSKIIFNHGKFMINNILLNLPKKEISEDIIIYSKCGGGNGYSFFKTLSYKQKIINVAKKYLSLLDIKFLCIHVRYTDYKCDFENFYHENRNIVDNYSCLLICTDNNKVANFYKSVHKNVFCFTQFPSNYSRNLHESNVDSNTKMTNVLVDIFLAIKSDRILSNSKGGFIKLLRELYDNKSEVLKNIESILS